PRLSFLRLFPYTTLFRSVGVVGLQGAVAVDRKARVFAAGITVLRDLGRKIAAVLRHAVIAHGDGQRVGRRRGAARRGERQVHRRDRKSTRLNSSHVKSSY